MRCARSSIRRATDPAEPGMGHYLGGSFADIGPSADRRTEVRQAYPGIAGQPYAHHPSRSVGRWPRRSAIRKPGCGSRGSPRRRRSPVSAACRASPTFRLAKGSWILRDPAVQGATFGRELGGVGEVLPGFRLDTVEITDSDVVSTSGSPRHSIAKATGDPTDHGEGTVFEISDRSYSAPTNMRSATISGSKWCSVQARRRGST